MKKVLHVLASNKYSGAENVVCTIIDNFKEEYEMAYCSLKGPIETYLQEKNIKYYGINKLNIKNIKKIIKEYNPNIIHAHDYTASVLVALSGFKGKIISHIHNNCPFAKKWNIKSILYSITINKYNNVIGVSNKVYEEAIFRKKLKSKYITIYNYVDKDLIKIKSQEYKYDKKYDLFFFGRLTEQKNPIEFIEIIKEIKDQNKKIKAVMIGDGELKEECTNMIQKYNLTENIDMLGYVINPFPIIKNCDIGILPSKWEGFGLTIIESLILNKVTFNSGVGGMEEIFSENKDLICNTRNEYITKILKNDKYNTNNIIEKFCDKKKWKGKLIKCYEKN